MSTFHIEVVDETAVKRPARGFSAGLRGPVSSLDDTEFAWTYRVVHTTNEGERLATFTGPRTKVMAWIKSREGLRNHTPKPLAPGSLHEQHRTAHAPMTMREFDSLMERYRKVMES